MNDPKLPILFKKELTENSVDGIPVSIDESCHDVHHAQDDEGEQQQGQDSLLRASDQTLDQRK